MGISDRMIQLSRRAVCNALAVVDDQPLPSEFLIFKKGVNETSKGDFIFDQQSAALVLGAFKLQGVEMIVDREHDSLSEEARAARKDAGDALAHYDIQLRPDGSLWAVNVAWNSEGEADLRSKKRRYTSPAFNYDVETGRILELINVALVSMPATYNNAPLIAARRGNLRLNVTKRAKLYAGSMQEVSDAVGAALNALYPPNENDPNSYAWVCDLFDGYAVFNKAGLLYKINYVYADGAATLQGEPLQVVRTYTPAADAIQLRVNRLIANAKKENKNGASSRSSRSR